MPRREDEDFNTWRHIEQGHDLTPLCPFCGRSDGLRWLRSTGRWKCLICGKSFPQTSGWWHREKVQKDEFAEHYERMRGRQPAQRSPKDEFVEHHERMQRAKVSRRVSPTGYTRSQTYRPPSRAPIRRKKHNYGVWIPILIVASLAFLAVGFFGLLGNGNEVVQTENNNEVTYVEADKHVYFDGFIQTGSDGHYITLEDNPDAINPTWSQLKAFLKVDDTDEQTYNDYSFVCADFAEMLHNNAEAAGIRAAYVGVDLVDCPTGHALNAFNTPSRGVVYIDSTGTSSWDTYPCSCDTLVDVEVGREYIPESIFPCQGWSSTWGSLGKVTQIHIQW